jgi:hypothetical protein
MLRGLRPWAPMALVLDCGTLSLLFASPLLIREAWNTSLINLVQEYRAEKGEKEARLRLFRNGRFTIRLERRCVDQQPGFVARGTAGTWRVDGDHIELTVGQESARFQIDRSGNVQKLRQSAGFVSWESREESSLAKMIFAQVAPAQKSI